MPDPLQLTPRNIADRAFDAERGFDPVLLPFMYRLGELQRAASRFPHLLSQERHMGADVYALRKSLIVLDRIRLLTAIRLYVQERPKFDDAA